MWNLFSVVLALCSFAAGADWPQVSFKTENFTTPSFNVTQTGQVEDGYLFLGIASTNSGVTQGPLIVDNNGSTIWHGIPDLKHTHGFRPFCYNFQAITYQNKPALSYWCGFQVSSHGYGRVTIVNDKYEKVQTVCLPKDVRKTLLGPAKLPGDNCFIDKHESYYTTNNSIVVSTYNITQADLTSIGGPKNGWVYEGVFFELELGTNKVLFSWSSLNHVPVTKSNYINKKKGQNPLLLDGQLVGHSASVPWDYFHINSIQKIQNGYLVNSRYTWSFYLVNDTSGNIEYTAEGSHGGDFTFKQKDIFWSYEHNPRLIASGPNTMSISLFNNDADKSSPLRNHSTGLLLTLNTKDMTIKRDRDLRLTEWPTFSRAEGNYQALANGHAIVGYGSEPTVAEYDASGQAIYIAQFARANPSGSTHSYRAYRFPWTAQPPAKPKIVALQSQNHTHQIEVYMSWNGATEVASWNILAGSSRTQLRTHTKQVAKNGFETMHIVRGGSARFVQAQALDANQNVLGQSAISRVR